MRRVVCSVVLLCALQSGFPGADRVAAAPETDLADVKMVDPAIDAAGPFSYLAFPCNELAVPGARHGTQVTYDGALYNGAAELCFFSGKPLKPVVARQKTFLEGWIPVLGYSWRDGAVDYAVEAFAASLTDDPLSNTITFVRLLASNRGVSRTRARVAAGIRFSGGKYRFEHMKPFGFSPDWRYEMTSDLVVRDGKALLVFPSSDRRESVVGTPYEKPFIGARLSVLKETETCLNYFEPVLAPGETAKFDFRFPVSPVPVGDTARLSMLRAAGYDHFKAQTVAFWKRQLSTGATLVMPEQKVLDAHRASLCYDFMALWQKDDMWMPGVNKFQYNWFWLRDGAYIVRCFDIWGQHEIARKCLESFRQFQQADGNFSSQPGQTDGFGQALFALGQHFLVTGDRAFGDSILPHFQPAISWLKRVRADDALHLIPPTNAADNELIKGRYTGHNFWALLGLRTSARVAKELGRNDEATSYLLEYADFQTALMAKLDSVSGKNGYIPPGLDVEGGQDWGNLLGAYPTEVLDPEDPRIAATMEKMHREKYAEGIMTYCGRLHHYLTVKATQNHVLRGEQEQTLKDFYGFLLHTGSAHEGFEWTAEPWGNRDVGNNLPPHGWGAAMFNILLRNMLVMERGGNGGIEGRELHLFSVVSPEWAKAGNEVGIRHAPTELGTVSAVMRFSANGAEVVIEKQLRKAPLCVVVNVPYFAQLEGFDTDATSATRDGNRLILTPDVSRVTMHWKLREVTPLSFDQAVDDYKREYARRFSEYRRAGKEAVRIEAPKVLTAKERQVAFRNRWSEEQRGIAVGKPVTSSGNTEGTQWPGLAVDGDARDLASAWWAGPAPQWLEVDLSELRTIAAIHVFPHWDGERYYQYTVEVSTDGNHWKEVIDRSGNRQPATESGDRFPLPQTRARFVRINMLKNSANSQVHLVELRVLEAPPKIQRKK